MCYGCEGKWLEAARKLLERHGIMASEFGRALHVALAKGRGKYQTFSFMDQQTREKLLFFPL